MHVNPFWITGCLNNRMLVGVQQCYNFFNNYFCDKVTDHFKFILHKKIQFLIFYLNIYMCIIIINICSCYYSNVVHILLIDPFRIFEKFALYAKNVYFSSI